MMLKCVVIFLIIFYNGEGKPQEIQCPDYCACDIWNGLRRATCQNKKLFSMEIGMPPQVQILDMSNNQVSELSDNIFRITNLTNLKLLNLSDNKVGQIHLNGFEGLEELTTLDLSFNNVQYFNEQWFISMKSLQALYLRGNNLMSINDDVKLNIPHLKILDISQCNIEFLRHGTFNHLHKLQSLDLSDNILSTIHVNVLHPLKSLVILLAKNNPLRCKHEEMTKLRNYTNYKHIHFEDSCEKNLNRSNHIEKFQRMIVEKPTTPPHKNAWLYEEEHTKVVPEIIYKKNETLNSTRHIVDDYLMKIIDLSPSLVLLATMIFGINIGLLCGCLCQLNSKSKTTQSADLEDDYSTPLKVFPRQNSVKNIINTRTRTRSVGSRRMIREDRSDLLSNEGHIYDSTPVLTRKIMLE